MQSTLFNQSVAHPTACRDRSSCLAHSIRLERSVRPRTTCAAQQEDSSEQANVCPTCGIDNASRPRGYMCAYHQFHYYITDPSGLYMIQARADHRRSSVWKTKAKTVKTQLASAQEISIKSAVMAILPGSGALDQPVCGMKR